MKLKINTDDCAMHSCNNKRTTKEVGGKPKPGRMGRQDTDLGNICYFRPLPLES